MWAQRMRVPGVFEAVDVPAPSAAELPDGAVLLRTLAGGICGSDLPKLRGAKGAVLGPRGEFLPGRPGFPMHEVVGEVVASRHPEVVTGSRVVGWAAKSDALAEYVVTDGEQLNIYDPRFEPREAVLIQSLACVLYALERVPLDGRDVVILGAGPIGALFAHAAKDAGARRVTGIDPVGRSELPPLLGFDETLATTSGHWSGHVGAGERPQVVIEAVGHQVATLEHAIAGVAPGGTVLYFGIPDDEIYPLDMESLMRKNLALIGGVTRDRRRALARADEYLQKNPGLYEALVTHEFDRGSVQQAFDVASRASAGRLKVVLRSAERSAETPLTKRPGRDARPGPFHVPHPWALRPSWIILQTRSGVSGSASAQTPVACWTAAAIAPPTGILAPSPTPLAPYGPVPSRRS
jgi:threonine dehydrogenase-like Zn-dependent dehydrogenase